MYNPTNVPSHRHRDSATAHSRLPDGDLPHVTHALNESPQVDPVSNLSRSRSWATKVTGRWSSSGRRRWGDGVVASREADADVQPTGGHGGCVHGAAVRRGDR